MKFEKWSVTATKTASGHDFTKVECLGITNISEKDAELLNTHSAGSLVRFYEVESSAPAKTEEPETIEPVVAEPKKTKRK